MPWFIILSLGLAAMAAGMVVVAALALRASVRRLTEESRQAMERLAPLTDELRAEQAVTQLEIAALQRRGEQRERPDPPGVRYP